MTSNEMDGHFAKCLGYLHASNRLRKGDAVPLQYLLEDAIQNKYGIARDYTDLVQACLPVREETFTPVGAIYEETKGSNSDNELELDLLKEDLMCVICNGMDIGARNRLVECSDCHSLYHQECHKPVVTDDSFDNWICFNCQEASKQIMMTGSSGQHLSKNMNNSQPLLSSSSTSYKASTSFARSLDK